MKKITAKEIETVNELLTGLSPVNVTIREAGICLSTFTGAEHLNKSLGWVWEHNGRGAREDVARFALSENGLSESEVDEILSLVDVNWYDSSLVDDIKYAVGDVFTYGPKHDEVGWEAHNTYESLRRA